ncbi:MAG TPA: hypothetical protein VK356_00960 [Thermomicrobiales bacterium]|nr:hypothetical protein [Thermomicrobiales bacterium]
MILLRMWMFALTALLIVLGQYTTLAQEPQADATSTGPPPPPEVSQPAYDVLRIDDNGIGRAYRVWEEWVPQVVTTPDGGAWAFFTAQIRTADGLADRRLYASRFDPESKVWLPAMGMGTSATQFGATAATDSQGVVHLIYSNRATDSPDSWSQLVYRRFVDGSWTDPVPVAPHPDAGHQMLASLAIDAKDGLHVIWRDQRLVTPEARTALPTNADLVASDFVAGEWTEPTQINVREAPDVNPAWPHLVVDGDRLVVVWSIYRGTTAEEMKSAVRVEWSGRSLDATSSWSTPRTLYVREGGDAGGRLIDLAADPRGGAVVVYGLYNRGTNDLFMQRLDGDQDDWSEPALIASGDFGYLPAITITGDGTIYAVFNNGRNRDVDIGGLIADPSGRSAGAVTLTPAEGGITARASIAVDGKGMPWVIYMHQPAGSTNVTEIQSVRAATFIPPAPA